MAAHVIMEEKIFNFPKLCIKLESYDKLKSLRFDEADQALAI